MKKRIFAYVIALMLVLGMAPVFAMGEELVISREALGLPDLEITSDTVKYLTWQSQKEVDTLAANLLMQEIYGCKLRVVRTTYSELPTKAANLRLSNNSPDLIMFRNHEFPSFIIEDVAMDITDYLDFSDPLFAGLEEAANAYAYKGRYYAYPAGKVFNNNYFYFWTSFFEELGLETPMELYEQGDWTYSTLRELMKELALDEDRDDVVDTYALVLTPMWSFSACGEDFVTYDPETGLYSNNIRSAALAEYFNFIYDTGIAGDNTRLMSLEDTSSFASKSAVMMLGEKWVMGTYYDEIMDGEVGVAPSPRMDGADKHYVQGRIETFWIGKDCKNLNGALAYLACCRAVELNPELSQVLKERAGQDPQVWPEEYQYFRNELMDDPEKFTILIPRVSGAGSWGDDTFGFWHLLSETVQFDKPWATAAEEHYPLLQDSINQVNGIYADQ